MSSRPPTGDRECSYARAPKALQIANNANLARNVRIFSLRKRSAAAGTQIRIYGPSAHRELAMKIPQLANAFRRAIYQPEITSDAAAKPAQNPPPLGRRPEDDQLSMGIVPTDTTEISPEAVFRYVASQYDIQHISLDELHDLVDLLYDGQAISPRDYEILTNGPSRGSGVSPYAGPEVKRNIVAAWQDQRIHDTARGDISAVESDSRALSILGRLASATA